MIAPCCRRLIVHALLDHAPVTARRKQKGVVIQLKTVLHGGVIDFCRCFAGMDQSAGITSKPFTCIGYLLRALTGCRAFTAGSEQPPLAPRSFQRFLDRTADRRGDAARMPVEPEDAPERLKPERIGQPSQHLRGSEFDDEVGNDLA